MNEKERPTAKATVPAWAFILLACVTGVLAGILTFVLLRGKPESDGKAASSTEAPQVSAQPAGQTAMPTAQPTAPAADATAIPFDPFDGAIETPIGSFDFSAEMARSVRMQDDSSDECFSQTYFAYVGDEEVKLFALLIGNTDRGIRLGSAPDASGAVHEIFLDIDPVEPGEGWSEDDVARINRLQECVNDIIDQIRALDGFED